MNLFTAQSDREGLKIVQQELPDVILLDLGIPGMDGYEVCTKLKAEETTKYIPIIILTANRTDSQSRVKALDSGADAFLTKPIDKAELIAQVNAMLRIKRAEDKLRQEKDVLEELVQERTKELQHELEDRKQVEESLRESEERYKELFNNMSSGVAVYEAIAQGKAFIFKDFNRAGERIENVRKEDIIGKSVLEMFPGVKDFGLFEIFQRVWETGEPENHPISLYQDERLVGMARKLCL